MRAGRLISLLGMLQARGRITTRQLAAELEVSQRTILRDIEALSAAGIPVYATRGRLGGFQLMDGFTSELLTAKRQAAQPPPGGGVQRARIRVSPRGRRLAALLGRPAGLRIARGAHPAPGGWAEAWIRIDSPGTAVLDLLALGAEVEVVHPPELRSQMARTAIQIADLHAGQPG